MSVTGKLQAKNEAKQPSKIPRCRSIEEEEESWDTHDSTEFEDEFEDLSDETRFVLTRPNERWIPLELDDQVMKALEERAR
jgi:hypothetical protein